SWPREWMQITENPARFYSLRIEPVRSALQVGDPVLLRVTITNISDYDLTMGPEGVIHPDLWFDAQLKGVAAEILPWESFDRMNKRTVPPGKQSVSQTLRHQPAQSHHWHARSPL